MTPLTSKMKELPGYRKNCARGLLTMANGSSPKSNRSARAEMMQTSNAAKRHQRTETRAKVPRQRCKTQIPLRTAQSSTSATLGTFPCRQQTWLDCRPPPTTLSSMFSYTNSQPNHDPRAPQTPLAPRRSRSTSRPPFQPRQVPPVVSNIRLSRGRQTPGSFLRRFQEVSESHPESKLGRIVLAQSPPFLIIFPTLHVGQLAPWNPRPSETR